MRIKIGMYEAARETNADRSYVYTARCNNRGKAAGALKVAQRKRNSRTDKRVRNRSARLAHAIVVVVVIVDVACGNWL